MAINGRHLLVPVLASLRTGAYHTAKRWVVRHRAWLALTAVLAALLCTCPSRSSFTQYVRFQKRHASAVRALGGAGRLVAGAREFFEAAIGTQRFTNYGVFSTARHGGHLYLGGRARQKVLNTSQGWHVTQEMTVGTCVESLKDTLINFWQTLDSGANQWVRVPGAVEGALAGPRDAAMDVQVLVAACVAVWFLGWFLTMVPREWMWRHFTASPAGRACPHRSLVTSTSLADHSVPLYPYPLAASSSLTWPLVMFQLILTLVEKLRFDTKPDTEFTVRCVS